ncbi:MAG: hypothetical protein WBZ20_18085 [Nitrososphaeraceae archaeon]
MIAPPNQEAERMELMVDVEGRSVTAVAAAFVMPAAFVTAVAAILFDQRYETQIMKLQQ